MKEVNELNRKARGGTELLMERLHNAFPSAHKNFQIIPSRVRSLDPNRKKILYVHDLAEDPESQHLKNEGWKKFDKIVFVSAWQQFEFNKVLGVPYEAGIVIPNSINPIKMKSSVGYRDDPIKLIYFSTPHRGLDILTQFCMNNQKYMEKRNVCVDVFSSFDLYGWEERDSHFEEIFKQLTITPRVSYHKSISNEEMRSILQDYHVFAYPSTWTETSCLCLIESMSAGLRCVHSSLGALPLTSCGLTDMYPYSEDKKEHLFQFTEKIKDVVEDIHSQRMGRNLLRHRKDLMISVADEIYNWEYVLEMWEDLFLDIM